MKNIFLTPWHHSWHYLSWICKQFLLLCCWLSSHFTSNLLYLLTWYTLCIINVWIWMLTSTRSILFSWVNMCSSFSTLTFCPEIFSLNFFKSSFNLLIDLLTIYQRLNQFFKIKFHFIANSCHSLLLFLIVTWSSVYHLEIM